MDLPVLIIGFNRPREFNQVLMNLKKIGVTNLFISLDGPREQNFEDVRARKEILNIINNIDWCKPLVNLIPQNCGCRKACNDAISWFFSHVEYGIINEDDIILSKDFFSDCEYFLKEYQNNQNVMSISAHSEFSSGTGMTHFLSPFCRFWGWATWSDRWSNHLDCVKKMQSMNFFSAYRSLPTFIKSFRISAIINASKQGRLSAWDYEANISHSIIDAKSITPYGNYVTNIGCGNLDATHTADMDSPQSVYSISKTRGKLPVIEMNELEKDMADLIRARCHMEPLSFFGEIRSILGIMYRLFMGIKK